MLMLIERSPPLSSSAWKLLRVALSRKLIIVFAVSLSVSAAAFFTTGMKSPCPRSNVTPMFPAAEGRKRSPSPSAPKNHGNSAGSRETIHTSRSGSPASAFCSRVNCASAASAASTPIFFTRKESGIVAREWLTTRAIVCCCAVGVSVAPAGSGGSSDSTSFAFTIFFPSERICSSVM